MGSVFRELENFYKMEVPECIRQGRGKELSENTKNKIEWPKNKITVYKEWVWKCLRPLTFISYRRKVWEFLSESSYWD